MRETVLMKGELATIVIVTASGRTEVLDGEDEVLESYEDDRHEAVLARYLKLGWEVEEDGP
jgi:hypothetical protein